MSQVHVFGVVVVASACCDDPQAVWLDCDRLGLVDPTHPLADTCCDGLNLKEIRISGR